MKDIPEDLQERIRPLRGPDQGTKALIVVVGELIKELREIRTILEDPDFAGKH
jgi:hypothetical protein